MCHGTSAIDGNVGTLATMIAVVTDPSPPVPGLDAAVSRALLYRTAEGAVGETFRLHVPAREVAFGKHDTLSPGYPAAVDAARTAGFEAVERLTGGRAAVFHEGTLAFAWTMPDPDPTGGIHRRFRRVAELLVAAFSRLDITAAVGEVPGEYCPGAYSIHVEGHKVMGVGQRLTRGAAHLGGVVTVSGAGTINEVLVPVYEHLGVDWDPATTGALDMTRPGLTVPEVAAAILTELAASADTAPAHLDDATLDLAARLAPEHRSP